MADVSAVPIIEANRLSKVYRGRQVALNDVSFRLERGWVLGLIGPNGAGKSTLLRLMMGQQIPTSGWVKIFGHKMHPNAASLRRRMGYIPTHPRMPAGFTPMAYLDYVASLHGMGASIRRPKIASLLRSVGMLDLAGDRMHGFSHGMLARLAVAASLVNDPELLIWDEPMHGLDPVARRNMFSLIKNLGDDRTLIVTSHHLSDIDELCSHVAVMSQGHLLSFGTLEELQEDIGCRQFEIELSGDNKTINKCFQTIKTMTEVATATLWQQRRIEILVKEGTPNSAALANVFMELASNKVEVTGLHSLSEPTETAFLTLVGGEDKRGFVRIHQDRAAA